MGAFSSMKLTSQGMQILTRALTNEKLSFTEVVVGDGYLPDGADVTQLTGLVSPVSANIGITGNTVIGDGTVNLKARLISGEISFFLREIGIMAKIGNETPILYAYANAGDYPDFIPSAGKGTEVVHDINLITIIGEASNIEANIILAAGVNSAEFEKHRTDNVIDHPDGSVTLEKIAPDAIDSVPISGSNKLVTSGGVANYNKASYVFNKGAGWYRIAYAQTNASGYNATISIHKPFEYSPPVSTIVSITTGYTIKPSIVQLNNKYETNAVPRCRVVYPSSGGGEMYFEIYFDGTTNEPFRFYMQSFAWQLYSTEQTKSADTIEGYNTEVFEFSDSGIKAEKINGVEITGVDTTPTLGSGNLATSGGVAKELAGKKAFNKVEYHMSAESDAGSWLRIAKSLVLDGGTSVNFTITRRFNDRPPECVVFNVSICNANNKCSITQLSRAVTDANVNYSNSIKIPKVRVIAIDKVEYIDVFYIDTKVNQVTISCDDGGKEYELATTRIISNPTSYELLKEFEFSDEGIKADKVNGLDLAGEFSKKLDKHDASISEYDTGRLWLDKQPIYRRDFVWKITGLTDGVQEVLLGELMDFDNSKMLITDSKLIGQNGTYEVSTIYCDSEYIFKVNSINGADAIISGYIEYVKGQYTSSVLNSLVTETYAN